MVLDRLGKGLGFIARKAVNGAKHIVVEVSSIPSAVKEGFKDVPYKIEPGRTTNNNTPTFE